MSGAIRVGHLGATKNMGRGSNFTKAEVLICEAAPIEFAANVHNALWSE